MAAHTPGPGGNWHDLVEHLSAVAANAKGIGDKFGAGPFCELLGWLHDIGKSSPAFQQYIRQCAMGYAPAKKAPHAPIAAWIARSCSPAVFPLLGHHAGLHDRSEVVQALQRDYSESASHALNILAELGVEPAFTREMLPANDPLEMEFLIRMAFSALVDADFLDTEAHFDPSATAHRAALKPFSDYLDELDRHLTHLRISAAGSPVNTMRCEILDHCCRAAERSPGLFRLTVPTGGGKTLSSVAFALRHAVRHRLDRVIVAIPYTSIIEQTAEVYAGIFGREHVLEHHSATAEFDAADEGQEERELRRRLAAENWDVPLVVTTNVQLFESLFANRPSKCRKLHNIARSVIILDEVQVLPVTLTKAVVAMLHQLVSQAGCTVVLCTATQPAFEALQLPTLETATDIVPHPERYYAQLRRVEFERPTQAVEPAEVADALRDLEQVLCIVNGRRDALTVVAELGEDPNAFHLSTLMCPLHRRAVLAEVRSRLSQGLSCRLVSTQVVEAGVDLDFPVVYRAIAPLDRIGQAAGRCNREGTLSSPGRCVIFDLAGGTSLRGEYTTGTDLARTILTEDPSALHNPDTFQRYFADLYANCDTDAQGIHALRTDGGSGPRFREVADRFRLIPEATKAVVVRYADQVDDLLVEARRIGSITRDVARRLHPHSVAIYQHDLQRHLRDGTVTEPVPGLLVWEGAYDQRTGIGGTSIADPADLVV